jgi:hypothetical protein
MSSQATKTASGVSVVNAAETAVVTSDLIASGTGASFEGVEVRGVLTILTGASTTAVVVTVRKGSGLAGAIVGAARTHTIGAAANAQIAFCELDTTPTAAGQQYTVSATQTAGSASGTASCTVTTSPSSNVPG